MFNTTVSSLLLTIEIMDWDSKFTCIFRDTELNLDKIRVNKYEMNICVASLQKV